MKRLIIAGALLFYLSALVGLFSHAAALAPTSPSNITVRPFLQQVTIKPGDTQQQFDLTIDNGSKFTQLFHLTAVNFGSLNETGGLVFEGVNVNKLISKYGLANWLSLDRNDIQLGANQQAVVKVTITNASDLSPGAHYAAIVTTASKPIESVGQLTITPKVSSLIFATKLGGEVYDMHLVSLSQNGSRWNLPTNVSLRFKSTGNTFIVPRGIVWLKQGRKVIAKGIINEQSSIVLPETIRSFDASLTQLAKPSKGLFTANYQVQVDYRYDGINSYATQSNTYRVLNPITPIVLVMALLAAIIVKKYRQQLKRLARKLRK
jgi:hypothetical protein